MKKQKLTLTSIQNGRFNTLFNDGIFIIHEMINQNEFICTSRLNHQWFHVASRSRSHNFLITLYTDESKISAFTQFLQSTMKIFQRKKTPHNDENQYGWS